MSKESQQNCTRTSTINRNQRTLNVSSDVKSVYYHEQVTKFTITQRVALLENQDQARIRILKTKITYLKRTILQ